MVAFQLTFLSAKIATPCGEGKTHYEVNSNNGVNSYHGVEGSGRSSLSIFAGVGVAIISVKDRLVIASTLIME